MGTSPTCRITVDGTAYEMAAGQPSVEGLQQADIYLRPQNSSDLVWLCALTRYMFDQGCAATEFLENHVNGVAAFRKSLAPFTLDYAEEITLIPKDELIFRLLHDLGGSLGDISALLARDLDTAQGRTGLANLFLLTQVLGDIPTSELQRALQTAGNALARMEQPPAPDDPYPPGLLGVGKLLRDEELWQALGLLLEGLKAYAAHRQSGADPTSE